MRFQRGLNRAFTAWYSQLINLWHRRSIVLSPLKIDFLVLLWSLLIYIEHIDERLWESEKILCSTQMGVICFQLIILIIIADFAVGLNCLKEKQGDVPVLLTLKITDFNKTSTTYHERVLNFKFTKICRKGIEHWSKYSKTLALFVTGTMRFIAN